MSEETPPELDTQVLIHQYPFIYFLIQMFYLSLGVIIMVIAAQMFLHSQYLAIALAALSYDVLRMLYGSHLHHQRTGKWIDKEVLSFLQYFLESTPRRWLEYALIALPANAIVTFAFHMADFDSLNNAATAFFDYAEDVIGLVVQEVSKLKSGAASLTVNFGLAGVLEYVAMRWLFAKRKLKNKKKT